MFKFPSDRVSNAIKNLPFQRPTASSHAHEDIQTQQPDEDLSEPTSEELKSQDQPPSRPTTTAIIEAPKPDLPPRPDEETQEKPRKHFSKPLKRVDPQPVEESSPEKDDNMSEESKPQEQQPLQAEEAPEEMKAENIEPLKGDESDVEIAKKLSAIIDNAIERVSPLLEMMNEHLAKADHDREEDKLNEEELVKQVKPLIEQATNILRETHGAIKALDPDGTIANNAQRKAQDHEASKEEQHLAESLSKLTGDVTKTIENAKEKIKNMPNAKKDLGPLLDMLSDPLFQIVSGVGLLLNGVLSLVGRLLDGLGLGNIVRNILSGLGLEKVLKGLGLTGLFKK